MKKLNIILKISFGFALVSFMFFALSLLEVKTKAQIFAPNTFVPSEGLKEEKEAKSILDSLAEPYLSDANSTKTFSEFTEDSIDPNGFYLRIDKIDLFKAIVQDVDPRYKDEYVESWNKGVSHGKFTATPDQIGITYLFSHAVSNSRNALDENAWFTHMDDLVEGDEVIIYYKGTKYTYEVSEIHIVTPEATGFYTGVAPVQKVRMQFCGPPTGSLASRTLVDALLISEEVIL